MAAATNFERAPWLPQGSAPREEAWEAPSRPLPHLQRAHLLLPGVEEAAHGTRKHGRALRLVPHSVLVAQAQRLAGAAYQCGV